MIQERSGLDATTVDELIEIVFKRIEMVPEVDIVTAYPRAADATSPVPDADPNVRFIDRDSDDVVFLAAALTRNAAIWSDDTVFKHQALVPWVRTSDVITDTTIDI